jgi:hypothetical protein
MPQKRYFYANAPGPDVIRFDWILRRAASRHSTTTITNYLETSLINLLGFDCFGHGFSEPRISYERRSQVFRSISIKRIWIGAGVESPSSNKPLFHNL